MLHCVILAAIFIDYFFRTHGKTFNQLELSFFNIKYEGFSYSNFQEKGPIKKECVRQKQVECKVKKCFRNV